ncbi:MAG: FG-GAP repeat domain-containing protein, partial [Phycisphaerae bacterium]
MKGGFDEFDGGGLTILLGDGNGGWIDNNSIASGNSSKMGTVTAGDINSDGNPDLVYTLNFLGGGAKSRPLISMGDGQGGFAPRIFIPGSVDDRANDVAIADMNQDTIPDVIWTDSFNDWIVVALGNGDGTFAPWNNVAAQNPFSIAIADMNQDSVPDVVVTANPTQQGSIYVYLGDGTGNLTFASSSSGVGGGIEIANLNGDAFPDVITGGIIRFGLGDGTLSSSTVLPSAGVDIAVADFDLDGLDDVATISGGTNAPFRVHRNLGGGVFAQPVFFTSVLTQPRLIDAVDLNGDLLPDVLQTARNLGQNALLTVHLNTTPAPVSGDVNCDGVLDAADALTLAAVLVGTDLDACHTASADMNGDGAANGPDIEPFLAA